MFTEKLKRDVRNLFVWKLCYFSLKLWGKSYLKLIHLSHSVTFSLTYLRHCFISIFCGIFKFPTYFCHHLIVTFTYLFEKLFVDPNVCFIKRLFLFSRTFFKKMDKISGAQINYAPENDQVKDIDCIFIMALWCTTTSCISNIISQPFPFQTHEAFCCILKPNFWWNI